jgi:hypothetical protein
MLVHDCSVSPPALPAGFRGVWASLSFLVSWEITVSIVLYRRAVVLGAVNTGYRGSWHKKFDHSVSGNFMGIFLSRNQQPDHLLLSTVPIGMAEDVLLEEFEVWEGVVECTS